MYSAFDKPYTGYGLFFLTATIRWEIFRSQQLPQERTELTDTITADGIVHPFTLFPSGDDPSVAKNLHVVRKGGLADIQFLQQTAGAFLAAGQQFQDSDPVFIAQSLENQCHLLFVEFHGSASN